MRGFTKRALILLSSLEEYNQCTASYRYSYKLAVENLITYLQSMGVEHDCLITDQLATHMDMHKPTWLATGASEDMFFVHNFCGVPSYEVKDLSDAEAKRLREKFPIERGTAPAARFEIVKKRVNFMEKQLIKSYDFVVVFGKQYNVKTKPGDGHAVLRVNAKKFYTSLELSGEEVPINGFLQIPYGNQPLSEWGKYSGS